MRGPVRQDILAPPVEVSTPGVILGKARIPLQVDIGFGDAVTPRPRRVTLPTLLDLPAPALRAYPRETVVAEKLHAVVTLGAGNTRLKDFHDLWALARGFAFEGPMLSRAIGATFRRRHTELPAGNPVGLSAEFAGDGARRAQWRTFVARSRPVASPPDLPEVVAAVRDFTMPPVAALASGVPFRSTWPAGGPWKTRHA